jgi:uncharacterized membrane protein
MSIGILLLIGVGILILLGLAQQVLDRLYLNDKQALILLAAIIGGSFIDLPLYRGTPEISINLGGAIIPVALSIYVLSRAGTRKELVRGVIGVLLSGLTLYGASKFYEFDTHTGLLDPQYLWGLLTGVVAYLIGRSRRLAFIGATLGVVLVDLAHAAEAVVKNLSSPTRIGGAGGLDTLIIAGIIAVALAELIGESRERLQGGPVRSEERPKGLLEPDHREGEDEDEE